MAQRFPPVEGGGDNCRQVRLAESELVAVDCCNCGAMRVHLGAMTLRVTPEALARVAETLEQALLAHGSLAVKEAPLLVGAAGAMRKLPRGQS